MLHTQRRPLRACTHARTCSEVAHAFSSRALRLVAAAACAIALLRSRRASPSSSAKLEASACTVASVEASTRWSPWFDCGRGVGRWGW